VDALTSVFHQSALSLLEAGQIQPVARAARALGDLALMRVTKSDSAASAGSNSVAQTTALQWNALAAIAHASGSSVVAAGIVSSPDATRDALQQLALVSTLMLPAVAAHFEGHPPRHRLAQASSAGYHMLSLECCVKDTLRLVRAQSDATRVPGLHVAALALSGALRSAGTLHEGQGQLSALESACSDAALLALKASSSALLEGDAPLAAVVFPLGRLASICLNVGDSRGTAQALGGAVIPIRGGTLQAICRGVPASQLLDARLPPSEASPPVPQPASAVPTGPPNTRQRDRTTAQTQQGLPKPNSKAPKVHPAEAVGVAPLMRPSQAAQVNVLPATSIPVTWSTK
jgi:hypothetical protein